MPSQRDVAETLAKTALNGIDMLRIETIAKFGDTGRDLMVADDEKAYRVANMKDRPCQMQHAPCDYGGENSRGLEGF